MEIKILELPKLPEEPPERGSVYDWMRFFRGKTKEEFEKMAAEYEYFDVAYNKLVKLSADDVKRMEYERHERNIRDIQAIEDGGYERGEEHGREVGRMEGVEITKKIFKFHIDGKSNEEIAKLCKLSVEKVESILN